MSRLPDGSRLDPIFFHQSAGAVVIVEDRCLALRRSDRDEWVFPKGHLEAGERPEDAAIREVLEETGLPIEIVASLAARGLTLEPIFHEWALLDREGAERILSHSADRELARRAFDLAERLGITKRDDRERAAPSTEEMGPR